MKKVKRTVSGIICNIIDSEKISPCPFCGREAEAVLRGGGWDVWCSCSNPLSEAFGETDFYCQESCENYPMIGFYSTSEDAIDAWNRLCKRYNKII